MHMCNMTHSCVWHGSFICVTWLIHMRDMAHSDIPANCMNTRHGTPIHACPWPLNSALQWVLQCALQCATVCCRVLPCVAVCYNMLQCIAVYCSVMQGGAVCCSAFCRVLQSVATYCNTLQYTATHCNTLQHAATHCNTLQHTATHLIDIRQGALTNRRRKSRSQTVALSIESSSEFRGRHGRRSMRAVIIHIWIHKIFV